MGKQLYINNGSYIGEEISNDARLISLNEKTDKCLTPFNLSAHQISKIQGQYCDGI